jgi:ABC-2 type transport system permease protein
MHRSTSQGGVGSRIVKFREIVRFELVYQTRRIQTWLYFAVLLVVAHLLTRSGIDSARDSSTPILANSPYGVAVTTVLCNVLWMLIATAVAGSAAARDVQTRMHPLVYTTPVSKADYLGGRFLAALVLDALILLMVPAGILLALLVPGAAPEILGPFRSAAYLSAYLVLALPTAFAVTAIQFSLVALNRRAAVSYVGSLLLLVTVFISGAVSNLLQMRTLGELLDPVGLYVLKSAWTPIEKNTLLVGMQGSMLANRILWIGIALGVLVFTYLRFRLGDPAAGTRSRRANEDVHGSRSGWRVSTATMGGISPSVVRVQRTFSFATHRRQVFAIASMSFGAIAKSATGLVLWAAVAMLIVLVMPALMELRGVPLVARTADVIALLTAPVADNPRAPWVLVPLLIVFYAEELVWRERDARLSEITDATPVPEWVSCVGKFLGLSLVLVTWMALLATAGVLGQARMGHVDFELGLYLRILFGIQLVDYFLFAVLVFAVHSVVNQKHVGYLVALGAYGFIAFASRLGIEHKLLVYASDPGWTYTDMRGFGMSLWPWLWFKLYWTAFALLFVVATTLLWVRGSERSVRARIHSARRRFTRPAAGVAATAVALILSVGGFIFYNTNVLHAYVTTADRMNRGADYERRYGRYFGIPQPRLTATTLRVEIYPERRQAEVRGTYRLVNDSGVAIESIHLATAPQVGTRAVSFDRRIARVLEDEDLDYRIYTLEQPLRPAETLQLTFGVDYEAHGFTNGGVDASVVANGTAFTNLNWLPAIGYQPNRELNAAGVRRQYGLAPRRPFPSLDDAKARRMRVGGDPVTFEAIVGTSTDQVAVAPGTLRRTWTEGGRRYFHYVTDVPINNQYGVFSAGYAVHEEQWTPSAGVGQAVAIQIFHHPGHTGPLRRMVASVRASLDHYTRQFSPYPYPYLRLIESPARGMGVQTEAATIEYGEGFSLLKRGDSPQDLDLVFAVVAHGVARGWWGMQVVPADVEGSGLLNTTLETYSAMRVVEETLGPEQLRQYLQFMRREYDYTGSRARAAPPLLRATDSFAYSRKGPFALYAIREYIGKDRVDEALRRLFEKHRSGTPPLPTSMDLYRELQAITPDQFQYLLKDLFEKNTFWELETERAAAQQTGDANWQVTLDVRARTVVVDEAGVETEVPMDDWLEVGVFDEGEPYLQKHRIHSGKQTITVTVAHKPARAGIDPRHLLSDLGEIDKNVKTIRLED